MIAALRLDAHDEVKCRGGRVVATTVRHPAARWLAVPSGPWVARLAAGGRREFVRPRRDPADGGALWYELPDGVYEVHALRSWREDRRYFVRSAAGRVVEIDGAAARAEARR